MTYAANCRLEYKVEIDWTSLPKHTNTLEGIPENVESMRFRREKRSHRGISHFTCLRQLVAFCVNQECLEEISNLPQLETLYLDQLTATDIGCLGRCRSLRHLVIKGGTKIPSLSWIPTLPPLESFLLENVKKLCDISGIESLSSLRAFGFEGSMWSTQRVASFQPITQLPHVEALFLTNCRPNADGLQPLHRMRHLRYLDIAAFFPDTEFVALRHALPDLQCQWFDQIDKHGSIKAAIKAMTTKTMSKGEG